MGTCSLNHARHDPAYCMAPLLFRSLRKGERAIEKLHVTYTIGDDCIEFSGPEPLGVDDLRVLQGLVAIAGPKGLILTANPQTAAGSEMRAKLNMENDAAAEEAIVVNSSYRVLAREIGYSTDSGRVLASIRDCIERLWKVSIVVQTGNSRHGYRLLSAYASEGAGGRLSVALNPRIADAVLMRRPYTRIDMLEVRGLSSDPARLIHQRLCGWVDPGVSRQIKLNTLCGYVWPESDSMGAVRKRRMTVRKALAELKGVGWRITEYETGKFLIQRP